MARLQLNKSSLAEQSARLRTYQRFLPALDLKRQQLMAERAKARKTVQQTRAEIAELRGHVGRELPMLGNHDVGLTDLVQVERTEIVYENKVGTRLPKLERIDVKVNGYSLLAKPHWVDSVVIRLRAMLELRIRLQVEQQREQLLSEAVDTITQRVNLFEKVLIPKTQDNIKRIRIYLSDNEMAAVVRSKIAKRKHAERALA
ncbi:MAG: V-type ATP synthase subunit D [Pseudomonadota bacterium]